MSKSWRGPSQEWRNRISSWEGSSMYKPAPDTGKVNNSFENEAQGFINTLPISIRSVLSDEALNALYSYSYNVGVGNFKKRVLPTLQNYVLGKATAQDVANHMYGTKDSKYKGLQNRRAYEREAFLKGVNSPTNTNISTRNVAPFTPTASPYTPSLGKINSFSPKNANGYTLPRVQDNKSSFWDSYTTMPEVPINKPDPISSVEYEPMFKTDTNVNTGSDYLNTIYSEQLEKMQDTINEELLVYKKQQDVLDAFNQKLASLETMNTSVNNIFAEGGYTVKKGDTLWKIAQENNISFQDLIAANSQIKDLNKINVGDIINYPTNFVNSTTPNNTTSSTFKAADADTTHRSIEEVGNNYEFSDPNNTNAALRYKRKVISGNGVILDSNQANILEKKLGHPIERDDQGNVYAVTDDEGNIKSVGTSFELPTAEQSVYGKSTLMMLKMLADAYKDGNSLYNNARDASGNVNNKALQENVKNMQAWSKATGISPHDAYFIFNKYVAEHGENALNPIPKSWYSQLGLDEKKVNRLEYASTLNKNSDTYQYLFNPNADVLRSIIATDRTISGKIIPGAFRLGAAYLTGGLSELALMGLRGAGSLATTMPKFNLTVNPEVIKYLKYTPFSAPLGMALEAWNGSDIQKNFQDYLNANRDSFINTWNGVLDVTDPYTNMAMGIGNWVTPNINSIQDLEHANIDPNNYLGLFTSGLVSGTTMPGSGKFKLGMGLASGLSSVASQYMANNPGAATAVASFIPAITQAVLSRGKYMPWSANGLRNTIDVATRASLNAGMETARRLGADALADYLHMSPADKMAFINSMSTGMSMGMNTFKGGRQFQNWVNTVSPGTGITNTFFTRSGGAPSMQNALYNVANNSSDKKLSITLDNMFGGLKNNNFIPNLSLSNLKKTWQQRKQEDTFVRTNGERNTSPNTYNGTSENSTSRRTFTTNYDSYQKVGQTAKTNNTYNMNDYGVREGYTYRDTRGNTIRVAGNEEVSQQAKIIRNSDGDVSFTGTTAPLWSLVAGEVQIKPGQKITYGDATVSNYTLKPGDSHYNASNPSKNKVILVEYNTQNTDIGSKVMGSVGKVQNSRALEADLIRRGYVEDISARKNDSHYNVDRARIKGTAANGNTVDMNLKGAILNTRVFKSATGNKDQDVFVMRDQDYSAPGSSRLHYALGADAQQITKAQTLAGVNNKQNFISSYITKDTYTVQEAQAILNKAHADVSHRDATATQGISVTSLTSQSGVISKSELSRELNSYVTKVQENIVKANTKGATVRQQLNAKVRGAASSISHRVVADLGSVAYTRAEVKAKLADLKKNLTKVENTKYTYSSSKWDQTSLHNLYEYQKKTTGQSANVKLNSEGKYEFVGSSIKLTGKEAQQLGMNKDYLQTYLDDATHLKALIAFGEE